MMGRSLLTITETTEIQIYEYTPLYAISGIDFWRKISKDKFGIKWGGKREKLYNGDSKSAPYPRKDNIHSTQAVIWYHVSL